MSALLKDFQDAKSSLRNRMSIAVKARNNLEEAERRAEAEAKALERMAGVVQSLGLAMDGARRWRAPLF